MNYFKACWLALTDGWFDYIVTDSVCGNGFQITLYGFKLLTFYVVATVARLIFALLFPITAIVIMRMKRYSKKQETAAMADL